MRGPPRMPDPIRAIDGVDSNGIFQVPQFAGGAANGELIVPIENRDTRRIVTAIFQAAQAIQNNGDSFPIADVAYDSAHIYQDTR